MEGGEKGERGKVTRWSERKNVRLLGFSRKKIIRWMLLSI